MRLLGHSNLDGHGETMQLMTKDNFLYVGHMNAGIGTSIVDVSDPAKPRLCGRLQAYRDTKCTKVQVAGNLLLVNYEQKGHSPQRTGFGVFDITDPKKPGEISYYNTGGQGVHRICYTGGKYAYITAVPPGFRDRMLVIIDLSNPEKPAEVGKWWYPGQWEAGGENPRWPKELKYKLHHANVWHNRAYLGYWDAGLIILDITDVSDPKLVSRLSWAPEDGKCTHTALPLPERNLVVVTDESTRDRCQEPPKYVRVIDINDEKNPRVLAKFPVPKGDFCKKGLRFGPHNLHENRPGSFRSDSLIFATYFNAGIRVYDLTDPCKPVEIDSYIPEAAPGAEAIQINDVYVEENGLIYLTDRVGGGIYILQAELRNK